MVKNNFKCIYAKTSNLISIKLLLIINKSINIKKKI